MSANEKLGDLYVKAAGREMTPEEKLEEELIMRELRQIDEEIKMIVGNRESEKSARELAMRSKNRVFREFLMDKTAKREILLNAAVGSGAQDPTGYIANSGAIELTIHDMIPTLHEGLGLPETLRIVTGVTGNEVWPVSVNDVEMEEVGEVVQLNDQAVDFKNITPVQHRCGLKVPVSYMAIDNAAFDLMSFVQSKFEIALRKYLAKKIYSQANFSGNHGPFSNLTPKGNIDLSGNAYKAILKAVAEFSDKGFFEGDVTIIMDRTTEAELKATPKLAGAAAGFVVEDGLCAGYPYVVTHYLNTEAASDGKTLVPTDDKFIGIGYFEWFACQQHGTVRLVNDPITLADKGLTRVILNTSWSMTDLSIYINGGQPTGDSVPQYPTQAFALYKVVDGTVTTEETTTT